MGGLVSQRCDGVRSFSWDTAHWGWALGSGGVWPSQDRNEFGASSPSACSEAVISMLCRADIREEMGSALYMSFCLAFLFPGSSRRIHLGFLAWVSQTHF